MNNLIKLKKELFDIMKKEEYKNIPVCIVRNLKIKDGYIQFEDSWNEVIINLENISTPEIIGRFRPKKTGNYEKCFIINPI